MSTAVITTDGNAEYQDRLACGLTFSRFMVNVIFKLLLLPYDSNFQAVKKDSFLIASER
jgi:hypothetical protein